jgi:hypothetical protein
MEGLLQLESKGFLKKTKKYFFKLTETELQYFKEDDKSKTEGALPLDGAWFRRFLNLRLPDGPFGLALCLN